MYNGQLARYFLILNLAYNARVPHVYSPSSNTRSLKQPEADSRCGGAGQAVRRTFLCPQMAKASSLVSYPSSNTSSLKQPKADFKFGGAGQAVRRTLTISLFYQLFKNISLAGNL